MAGRLGYRVIEGTDAEFPVLYTNEAIANAERLMKKGIIGVLSGFQEGESGVIEVAILFQSGVLAARRVDRYSGKRFTIKEAYKVLDDVGFSAVAAAVFEAVGEVIARDSNAIDLEFEDDEALESGSEKN